MKIAKISATVAAMLAQIWRNVAVCATCKGCEPCGDGTEGDMKVGAMLQFAQLARVVNLAKTVLSDIISR